MGHPDRRFNSPSIADVLENKDSFLPLFTKSLKDNKVNIVISTTVAGAGHWRQAERLVRFFDSLGLGDQITFIATDRTTKRTASISDLVLKVYPRLQQNYYNIVLLLRLLMNNPLGAKVIDNQVLEMAKQGEEDMIEVLKRSTTFNESNPTIFLSTHPMLAGGSLKIMEQRNNPDDWALEFVPDPWKGSDLRAMTIPHVDSDHWITVFHDEDTVKEYEKIRPDSKAKVVAWGTLSNAFYLDRRQHLESSEVPQRNQMDVIIECSGNYIPKYDKKIVSFIYNIAQEISQGKIRLVIDPMFHRISYNSFLEILKKVGLDNNPHVLLLENEKNMSKAVERRENIIEKKDPEVENYFKGNFDPFAVIAKGGEVPLEDRADMIVFCPFASVPHETGDIQAGVREGRAVDARKIDPSQWLLKLNELFEERRELPKASAAILAPALIYIGNYTGIPVFEKHI